MISELNSTTPPIVRRWCDLSVGMMVTIPFSFKKADMIAFEALSGDRSRIHKDLKFAKENGFEEPVVYGALTVARLSHLVGMFLPGDLGLATSWQINFNSPLYVDEQATFEGRIAHISEATQTVKIKFRVFASPKHTSLKHAEPKLIATGSAESKILSA